MKSKAPPKMFSTRIDPELLKKLKHLSVDLEKPISELVEEAIENLVKKHKNKNS